MYATVTSAIGALWNERKSFRALGRGELGRGLASTIVGVALVRKNGALTLSVNTLWHSTIICYAVGGSARLLKAGSQASLVVSAYLRSSSLAI